MTSPTYGRISQGFWALHKAVDVVNELGTPIVAPVAGKVTHVGQMGSGVSNAGNVVQIGNPAGDAHRLCHLNSTVVKVGQTVKEGQLVGYMGYTGFTIPAGIKGTHLHWIMFKGGVRVDPRKYVTIPATKPVAPKPPVAKPPAKMPPVGSRIQLVPKVTRNTFRAGTTKVAGTINATDSSFVYVVRGYDAKYPNRVLINSKSAGGDGVALALYFTDGKVIPQWKII